MPLPSLFPLPFFPSFFPSPFIKEKFKKHIKMATDRSFENENPLCAAFGQCLFRAHPYDALHLQASGTRRDPEQLRGVTFRFLLIYLVSNLADNLMWFSRLFIRWSSVLSNLVASSHRWPLSTWNVTRIKMFHNYKIHPSFQTLVTNEWLLVISLVIFILII